MNGGPEFKGDLRQATQAWNSKARIHAPHHHESAGIIEIFNRTIEKKISVLKHGTKQTWYDVYMDAIELYNSAPHLALSDGKTAILSPVEVFLGRSPKLAWDLPSEAGNTPVLKPSKYAAQLKQNAEKVNRFIIAAREDYLKAMETHEKHASHKLRCFEVGDEVTKYMPTGKNMVRRGLTRYR